MAGKLTPDGRCTDGSYDYYAANLLAAARAVVEASVSVNSNKYGTGGSKDAA